MILTFEGFRENRNKNFVGKATNDNDILEKYNGGKSECKYCIDYRKYNTLLSPDSVYDIVLLITSSHRKDAAQRRQILRSTWANNSFYLPSLRVDHVFILGELYFDILIF